MSASGVVPARPTRRRPNTLVRAVVLLMSLALVASACSDDGGSDGDAGGDAGSGGEVVDLATFATGAPKHLDPAMNGNVETYSVINALYDGLTDVDSSDPEHATVEPLVAEKVESSDDAKIWTFTIREDAEFSNGEPVLPSSFVRGWLRATEPEVAGPYANLFTLIQGGDERLQGADGISGVTADDDERTLRVELTEPYANFDVIAGFQVFFPMPEVVEKLKDPTTWDQGVMIGNGPFKLASKPTDREVVLERNDRWGGDIFGNERAKLDRIVFKVSASVDDAFDSLDAGEADTGPIPPARAKEVADRFGTTLETPLLSSYMLQLAWDRVDIGGPENVKLREAISLAIDRDEINEAVYGGARIPATGIVPPGIPGYRADLCKFCVHDVDRARKAFEEWKAAGHQLQEPLKLQVAAGAGHEPAFQIIVDELAEIGIEAQVDAQPQEAYEELLQNRGCIVCRWNWVADYPTYDNFLFDNFHSSSIGGFNLGSYSSETFDRLLDDARKAPDEDERDQLFHDAEAQLLNEDVAVIPMFWGRGNYAYDESKLENVVQTNLGLILWEAVSRKK